MSNSGRHNLTLAVSAFAILVGGIAITGWLFNIERLTTLAPGLPTMKFNTALGFMLAGLSIYFSQAEKSYYHTVSHVLSGLLILMGIMVLAGYAFNTDNHIDQLFVTDRFDLTGGLPGRMAASTALCFVLIAFGITGRLSSNRRIQQSAQICLHVITLFSTLAIMGYLFLVPTFYRFLMLNSMALHTAIGFFIFSVGATALYPDLGLAGMFTGNYTGNLMARRLFPWLAIATVALAFCV